jgi:hypothetical protein
MPTWLAIAIPSVIAVAAILMWALDYTKKAHEIQKLRLELEKLKREGEQSDREDRFRGSGLYTPTAEEVDKIGTHHGRTILSILRADPPWKNIEFRSRSKLSWRSRASLLIGLLLALGPTILLTWSEIIRAFDRLISWFLSK